MTELKLTNDERANRALSLAHAGAPTIWYFLDQEKGTRNGGRDPSAPHCATRWKDGDGKWWLTADCTALACWASGLPRKLKRFKPYGGRINTDAMVIDAEGPQSVFGFARVVRRGMLLVMPGRFAEDGERLGPGHVGVITGVPPHVGDQLLDEGFGTDDILRGVTVTHCSPRHHRDHHRAIATTDGRLWGSRRWRVLEVL